LTYGFKAASLRYANIIGSRIRHGVIYDFIMKLKKNPEILEVLGDGTQEKSYLYIDDAIDATLIVAENLNDAYIDVNVGNDDWIRVSEIAKIVSSIMNVNPKIIYKPATRDGRGWVGDVKKMLLSNKKLKDLGWRPRYSSREAVEKTARELVSELL
jgi:UDP-glucose 4-epimerase